MHRSLHLLRTGALCLLAAATLAPTVRAQTSPAMSLPVAPMRGDLDGNRLVNVVDAGMLLQSLLGLFALTPEQQEIADATGDGAVNIEDAVHILQQAVGIIPLSSDPVLPETPSVPQAVLNGDIGDMQVFPADNEWNRPVDKDEVDPNSDALIGSIGRDIRLHPDFGGNYDGTGEPFGIPFMVVSGGMPGTPVEFEAADESEPGPYPIPEYAPIEGGADSDGDRHVIVVDKDNGKLYEMFYSFFNAGKWEAYSGARFDLNSNTPRPLYWTSADAAGLPIFAGLVRYEEAVTKREIKHALRFTVKNTRKAFVAPARHWASNKTAANLPPMGMRVRLKASFDISKYPPSARVILQALKTYGMIVADNGGNWFLSGAADERWNDEEIETLKSVKGNDFEVVKMGPLTTK